MSQITMRNLDPVTDTSLRDLAKRRHQSLSTVTLDLVRQALGTAPGAGRRDLSAFKGYWSAEEAAAFDSAVAEQSCIDPGDWQ